MKTKHTPGRWYVANAGDTIMADDGYIAKVAVRSPNNNEGLANGVLMAAAPDLLEALRAVVAHANKRQALATAGMEDEELHRLEEPCFVQQAREAIAKATGSEVGK